MNPNTDMLVSQRVAQVCLLLMTAIALFGGALQMYLGQPDTTPRLDNIHRFMAGIYFTTGFINFWAAMTIRHQNTLVFLLAMGVLFAGIGRLVSMSQVGVPEPAAVWFGYLILELSLPVIMILAQLATNRSKAKSKSTG